MSPLSAAAALCGKLLLSLIFPIALFLAALGLPGTWLLLLTALAGLPFGATTWTLAVFCLGLAILAELVEFASGMLFAKRSGASRAGMFGALLGGLIGAALGSMLFPVLGTIVGGLLGTFLCAVGFELIFASAARRQAFKAGVGAFVGTMLGRLFKTGCAASQALLIARAIWTP